MKTVLILGLFALFSGFYSTDVQYQPSRSLLIVFDVSTSMKTSLAAMKEAAFFIANEIISKEVDLIKDFIIVPFADPCEYL